MDVYTLDNTFLPRKAIDEFTSLIWTERYSAAGDFQLVVPALPDLVNELSPGRFVALRGTSEIMVVDSESRENDLLTVTGSSLVKFLNNREAWFLNPDYDSTTNPQLYAAYTDDTQKAGQFLATVVEGLVISPVAFTDPYDPINFDWAHEKIRGLSLGQIDANGSVKRLTFPLGPLYDNLQYFASTQQLGFKLYLESATRSVGYKLKFATYRGRDRTSDQTVNEVVRLTTKMDSLLNSTDLIATTSYKNVVYVTYKNVVTEHHLGSTIPRGFKRFVLRVDAPDVHVADANIAAFRQQVAMNAFFQHAYIAAVDGQVSSQSGYLFNRDYFLGDVIELEGDTGLRSTSQVTEYIRSQDKNGVRHYPTLAIPDPTLFNFADLEQDPEVGHPWIDDPNYGDPGPYRIMVNYFYDDPENEDSDPVFSIGKITTRQELAVIPDTENMTLLNWTEDYHRLVIRRDDSVYLGPDDYLPKLSYWMMKPEGGDKQRLTDTIFNETDDGTGWNLTLSTIWAKSDGTRRLYASKIGDNPYGWIDLFHSSTGLLSDMSVFLDSTYFRAAELVTYPYVYPSPDGTKLYIQRQEFDSAFGGVIQHGYIVNTDETDFVEIDLGIPIVDIVGTLTWSQDSTKLYAMQDSTHYIVYDIASTDTSIIDIHQHTFLNKVVMSPNTEKLAWVEVDWDAGEAWLFAGPSDGTSATLLYHQPSAELTDRTVLFLENGIAWNFDSTSVVAVDYRAQSPVRIFDVNTADHQTAFAGDWDDDPQISTPMMFDE